MQKTTCIKGNAQNDSYKQYAQDSKSMSTRKVE